MESITILCYPKCSTCKKASQYLDSCHIPYTYRDITIENPSVEELTKWIKISNLPITRFFNTSGNRYKQLQLKNKLPIMSKEEMISLLASDGMLVKRPLLITNSMVLVGFKEAEWERIKRN